MTREEEIKAKSEEYLPDILDDEYSYKAEFVFGFQEGAKWADETMIAKACDWLENNVNNYIIIDDYLGKVQHKISSNMFDDFKKAMEEWV